MLCFSVSMFNQETEKYFPAKVRYTGDVQFNAPKILKTSCLLDVRYFPWDQQVNKYNTMWNSIICKEHLLFSAYHYQHTTIK